jgi:predicted Zn-dependent protease
MKRILLAALFAACVPASAQFGGFDLGKVLDIGKKAVDASKDFTQEEEIQIGDAATASFLGASPLHHDANLQRYVNRVGKWLALHSERPDLPWTFGVIDTETLNFPWSILISVSCSSASAARRSSQACSPTRSRTW